MADALLRSLLPGDLKVAVTVVTNVARDARARHHLAPVSASLLAQGLAAGVLMSSLQKGDSRINLQLECDGPFRGFFVDAGADGSVRGYAKNPHLDVELGEGPFRWRAALGNSGFVSVLRDIGEEYYRSSVELKAMNVAEDLNHYFVTSDQVPTRVAIDVRKDEAEPLGAVAGVLVQPLPMGDVHALEAMGPTLQARLAEALVELGQGVTADALLARLFPGAETLASQPVAFKCKCSRERALQTIGALGAGEVQHIVDTLGSTAVTCHFCGSKHEISLQDLFKILEDLGRPAPRG